MSTGGKASEVSPSGHPVGRRKVSEAATSRSTERSEDGQLLTSHVNTSRPLKVHFSYWFLDLPATNYFSLSKGKKID